MRYFYVDYGNGKTDILGLSQGEPVGAVSYKEIPPELVHKEVKLENGSIVADPVKQAEKDAEKAGKDQDAINAKTARAEAIARLKLSNDKDTQDLVIVLGL